MGDILTTEMMGLYEQYKKPTKFLSNFAKRSETEATSLELDTNVVKSVYAVDTERNKGGQLIDFSGYSTKFFTPPAYEDFSQVTPDELEEKLKGYTKYDANVRKAALLALVNDRQIKIGDMYRRSEEKQVSDALFNGKIVYHDGTKVEFDKKETHNYKAKKSWASVEGKALSELREMVQIAVNDGRTAGGEFNFITRGTVIDNLITNAEVQSAANAHKNINRAEVRMPLAETEGAVYHGQLAAGSSIINLWSYDQYCEIPKGYNLAGEGRKLAYIPDGGGVLLPKDFACDMKYAAVFPGDGENITALEKIKTQQLAWAYLERKNGTCVVKCGVKSRVLFIPTDFNSYVTITGILGQ